MRSHLTNLDDGTMQLIGFVLSLTWKRQTFLHHSVWEVYSFLSLMNPEEKQLAQGVVQQQKDYVIAGLSNTK